jgi:hypothetical protein
MGRIKSALEIALERTESVKGDKGSINQFEAKQRGKRLANEFLASPGKFDLEGAVKKTPKDELGSLKEGVYELLLSQIGLPAVPEDMARLEAVGRGLGVVIGDNRFNSLYRQLCQALSRYLDESAQYEEAIKRQYAPKLRQKEEELARRMGREVRIDPFQDPEFIAFYNQNINALKANYEGAVAQVREQAALLFKGKP